MRTALKSDCPNCNRPIAIKPKDYGKGSVCPVCGHFVVFRNSLAETRDAGSSWRWLAVLPVSLAAYAIVVVIGTFMIVDDGGAAKGGKAVIYPHIAIPMNCISAAFAV